jgi:very-short-patch-repair endonuclease
MPQEPVSAAELRARIGGRGIERALQTGALVRLRRGWYSTPGPRTELVAAVRAGGRLGCVSALAHHGAWTMPHGLHVRVSRGVRVSGSARIHWTDERLSKGPRVDPIETAVETAVGCLSREDAVVVLDSVLNRRLLREEVLVALLERTQRGRALIRHLDPLAESGLETLMRLGLRRRRLQVRSQVRIAGDRVDLLVGDRLVIELDGQAWHDRPGDYLRDRARDRRLVEAGFVVLRAGYQQVMNERDEIERQVLSLVRRREHVWRSPHARLGHSVRGYRG